jgi:hypothetical protein
MIDVTTKAGGLNTAVVALPIAQIIESALYPELVKGLDKN